MDNYEEKYKKALAWMQSLYKGLHGKTREEAEEAFPELKESEGEKVRKEILDYIIKGSESCYDVQQYGKERFEKWISWLERRGEHKPSWSKGDETTKNNISHIIRQYDKISKKENKPCWYIGDCLLWMQNIKGRVQPQPKHEWSGGDEAHLHSLITHLEQWIERHPNTTGADIQGENITWLKSLRPQSTEVKDFWKSADGDDLPEIDREVIVLIKYNAQRNIHDEEYPTYRVGFGHRPNPNGWDGKNIDTDDVTHYTPKLYDKGGWNIPNVAFWLDLDIPKL